MRCRGADTRVCWIETRLDLCPSCLKLTTYFCATATRTRWPALLAMIALGLLAGCSQTAKSTDPRGGAAANPTSSSRVLLSLEGQAWLRTTIGSGASGLRWPDFSDYSEHVKKFYESNGTLYGGSRTRSDPQARQLIALLLHADQKGLSAEDYDGPLWSDRLAGLKPAHRSPRKRIH